MALRTFSDILTEVTVRGGITTTAATGGLFTDTILNAWINDAYRWVAAYKKWPFTEGRVSTTYVSGTEEYSYPENWHSDSIRLLQVGGKRLDKLAFNDYQIFREDNSSSKDKVYSDFNRTYFINTSADISGSIVLYGQYTPAAIDVTDNTALTVFSDADEEGNEAIVEETLYYSKMREKLPNEAQAHHARAVEILEGVNRRVGDEQFGYQTKNREMFQRIDVLSGAKTDELIRRDRFPS